MSYKELKSYQQATRIYDFTVEFCKRYIDSKSRTTDQMIQAARSGKQNIVEGASERTSEKSELLLMGVARASLQELLEDYEDFLRQNQLRVWEKDSSEALEIRNQYKTNWSNWTTISYKMLETPMSAANTALCLIHQANFLLDQQIKVLEKEFSEKGDYAEQMSDKRTEERKKQKVAAIWRKFQ